MVLEESEESNRNWKFAPNEIQCQHGYIYIQYYIHSGYIYIREPGHSSWREGSYVRTCTVIHDATCDATMTGNTVMFTFQIYIHHPAGTLDVYISMLSMYYNDGTYVTSEHGGNTVRAWTGHRSVPPVTVTRKVKGAIFRSYHTIMEAIPYEHGQVTGHYCL